MAGYALAPAAAAQYPWLSEGARRQIQHAVFVMWK